jgi:quercetin dioxygenase-like cupin family protein
VNLVKTAHFLDTPPRPVNLDGADKVTIRWLISGREKAPNFAMRMFELQPGGHTPLHGHPSEHEVFIVEGEGLLVHEGSEHPFKPGYVIYVPPGDAHQFRNTGEGLLRFLCLIPNEKNPAGPAGP